MNQLRAAYILTKLIFILQLSASYFLTKYRNNAVLRENLMLCVPCVKQHLPSVTDFSVHEKICTLI